MAAAFRGRRRIKADGSRLRSSSILSMVPDAGVSAAVPPCGHCKTFDVASHTSHGGRQPCRDFLGRRRVVVSGLVARIAACGARSGTPGTPPPPASRTSASGPGASSASARGACGSPARARRRHVQGRWAAQQPSPDRHGRTAFVRGGGGEWSHTSLWWRNRTNCLLSRFGRHVPNTAPSRTRNAACKQVAPCRM